MKQAEEQERAYMLELACENRERDFMVAVEAESRAYLAAVETKRLEVEAAEKICVEEIGSEDSLFSPEQNEAWQKLLAESGMHSLEDEMFSIESDDRVLGHVDADEEENPDESGEPTGFWSKLWAFVVIYSSSN